MADQEFLASFGVDIDESGVSRLQQILTENKTLGDNLAASFNAAAEGVRAFKESVSTDLPSLFGSGYGNVTENLFGSAGGLKIGLNMTEPKKEIAGFTAEAKKEIPLAARMLPGLCRQLGRRWKMCGVCFPRRSRSMCGPAPTRMTGTGRKIPGLTAGTGTIPGRLSCGCPPAVGFRGRLRCRWRKMGMRNTSSR